MSGDRTMTDDEVLEFLEECLDDLGPNPGKFLLAKPEGATDAQWKAALAECGVESC